MLFSTYNDDFTEVGDWGDNSCCELYFFISLIDFEDVISCGIFFFNELFHIMINFIGTKMNLNKENMLRWRLRVSRCRFVPYDSL